MYILNFSTSSLPSLDWPLPSQYMQYDLKIEMQPKTHHRAHYETEGSRGAVKSSSGGHPVVKVLILLVCWQGLVVDHWCFNCVLFFM